jgi:hypothetical protein
LAANQVALNGIADGLWVIKDCKRSALLTVNADTKSLKISPASDVHPKGISDADFTANSHHRNLKLSLGIFVPKQKRRHRCPRFQILHSA